MRHPLPLVLAVLAGCSAPGLGTVYVFSLSFDPAGTGETTIDENFDFADPIGEGEDTEDTGFDAPPLTTEETQDASDQLLYGQIVPGKGDTYWLTLMGQLVPGTKEGKNLTFTWDRFNDETTTDSNSFYTFERTTESSSSTTLSLNMDRSVGGYVGTMLTQSVQTESWREVDEWEERDAGVFSSRIPSTTYLEGEFDRNTSTEDDCASENCRLAVTTTVDRTQDVVAQPTTLEPDDVLLPESSNSAGVSSSGL